MDNCFYNKGMTTSQSLYEVGTHIDLSHINKKEKHEPDQQPTSRDTLYAPGTRIVFLDWVSDMQKIAIQTPAFVG